MWSDKEALCLGLCGALTFIFLCSLNIEAQGLYYDEVHQAPAAFVLLGKDVRIVTALKWHKIPLLTMHYSGAIKSIIYGLFLKLTDRPFTVASWRLLGIFSVALGLFLFCVFTYRKLGRVGILLFFVLILTDTTVILTSRHDWGPTALALMLRLLWLAVWVQGEFGKATLVNTFLLGMVTGFSIYEKLVSVVLIFPFLFVLLMNEARWTRGHWLAGVAGIIIGGLPLLFINTWSYVKDGTIYSLLNREVIEAHSVFPLKRRIGQCKYYLGLGNGRQVRGWILGNTSLRSFETLELLIMSIVQLTIIIGGLLYQRKNLFLRNAIVMVFCYLTIWVWCIFITPKGGFVHHWIIGTPFQYMGITLCWIGMMEAKGTYKWVSRALHNIFIFAIVLLLLSRLPILATTVVSLISGNASSVWDISYTKVAEFAARHQKDSIYLVTTWGVGAQIYCLSNGQDNFVYELYSNTKGPDMIRRIITQSGKTNIYLVASEDRGINSTDKANTRQIIEDIKQMPELYEEPLVPELENLKYIKCIKYRYLSLFERFTCIPNCNFEFLTHT